MIEMLLMKKISIEINEIYKDKALLNELDDYVGKSLELAGEGNDIILTGQAPIWLYLKIAHALHGKAAKLWYNSPVTGPVLIFDHDPH